MSKLRFTDCDKWDDPWFMELAPAFKQLWTYLCDKCDNAGVWNVNGRLAEFHIGMHVDWPGALKAFGDRIQVLADGRKWHLVKFVAFQYPSGLGISNPHKQVIRLLASHGISPFDSIIKGSGGLQVGSMEPPRLDQTRPDSFSSEGGAGGNNLRVVEPAPDHSRLNPLREAGVDVDPLIGEWLDVTEGETEAEVRETIVGWKPPKRAYPSKYATLRAKREAAHAATQAAHAAALTGAIRKADMDERGRRAAEAGLASIEPLRAILADLVADPVLEARAKAIAPEILSWIRAALDTGRGNISTLSRVRGILADLRGDEPRQATGAQA